MAVEAKNFEQQVTRIFTVIENSGATVTWNSKIPDIEVPNTYRQIDVLIEKGDKKVIVECRNHKRPQDIQWVEHLDSKKTSVGADAVIGVSNSGFTNTAIKKAGARGVFLRQLDKISDEELPSWLNFKTVEVYYVQFKHIEIDIYIRRNTINYAHYTEEARKCREVQRHTMALLSQITQEKGDEIYEKGPQAGSYQLNSIDFRIGRAKVNHMLVHTEAHPYKQQIEGLTLSRFVNLSPSNDDGEALVHEIGNGTSELICGNKKTLWTTDLSQIEAPQNSVFHDCRIIGVYIDGEMSVSLIGNEKFNPFSDIEAHINLHFGDEPQSMKV